jgi:hypothetical protein
MLAAVTSEKRCGLPAVGLPLRREREMKLWCSVNSLSVKVRVWLRPAQRGRGLLDQLWSSLSWRPFLFSHPPSLPEIKVRTWFFCDLLELRVEKNGVSEMGLSDIFRFEASCAYTWCVQTADTLEDDQPAVQDICWGQPWMDKVCFTGSMFLLNGNKKCDWHALVVSAW